MDKNGKTDWNHHVNRITSQNGTRLGIVCPRMWGAQVEGGIMTT